ncbi:MAG: T9SS type A sorting domain-containing protein [Candidatus Kapaibacterium sp.]
MKPLNKFLIPAVLFFLICASSGLFAQTPQHFNFTGSGPSNNSFPFAQAVGKAVQILFLPGDFVQPAPLPAGKQITTIYFQASSSGAGSRTFTDLVVMMKQDSITSFPLGVFYSPLDTVYYEPSATLTFVANDWFSITLEKPFVYDPSKSLIVFVGQCGGSGAGGNIWQQNLSEHRRNWSVAGCPFVPYVGTSPNTSVANFGVDVTDVTSVTQLSAEIPVEYMLSQNFPNPFNPVTNIQFSIPKSGVVNITVYDAMGRKVSELVNGYHNAGAYQINFNASALVSGTYFYKLIAENFSASKRMILIK